MADTTRSPARLSLDLILKTALEIADREGLGGLSMRRLGDELGCAAMSLYEYVKNKDTLLDLVADYALSALPVLDESGHWRLEIVEFFTALYRLILSHPTVAHLILDRTVSGPAAITHADPVLATLVRGGLDDDCAVEAFLNLSNYTIGASLYHVTRTGTRRAEHDQRFTEVSSIEQPTLHRLAHALIRAPSEQQFRSGLDHLLAPYQEL